MSIFDTQPKHQVEIAQTGERYPCSARESLLQGMLRLGRRGIPVGCVNGGCGVCKIQVLDGKVMALGPISRAHVTQEEESHGVTLACRVAPQSAVCFEVIGKFEKPFRRQFELRQREAANAACVVETRSVL